MRVSAWALGRVSSMEAELSPLSDADRTRIALFADGWREFYGDERIGMLLERAWPPSRRGKGEKQ